MKDEKKITSKKKKTEVNGQEITWQPNPGPQTEVLKRTEYEILFGGARGGGKTDAGIAWLLRHIDNPNYRALVIRRNAMDLSAWVDRAEKVYRPTGAVSAYQPAKITFPSGAVIHTGHLKDEHAYTKYMGHEYQRIVVEELNQIPTKILYMKLLSSCRSTIPSIPPQVFCTTNPGGVGHSWVKRRFVTPSMPGKPFKDPKTGLGRIFIPSKIEDNPKLALVNPGYVRWLKGLDGYLRKMWYEGSWDVVAGQVFSSWNSLKHVVKPFEIPKDWQRYLSIDWGVNQQTAVGWYTINYDGRTYLYRELYCNGIEFRERFGIPLSPTSLTKLILKVNKNAGETYRYCVADPSMWNRTISGVGGRGVEGEGESIAETMITTGLNMIKGDNDRINGLGRYREMLRDAPDGKPWFQVFSNCKATIETIPALPYKEDSDDVDTRAEDHCYDRDRYFFMSRSTKPEKEVVRKESRIKRFYRKAVRSYEADQEDGAVSPSEWRQWLSS